MESNRKNNGPDYSDTGQWQLIVNISRNGIFAGLHIRHSDEPARRILLSQQWDVSEESLLDKIEDSIYDNPSVLDDYSAQIVIETPRTIFVPTAILEQEEDPASFFTDIYNNVLPEDIMREDVGGVTALFFLTPGLKSFLARTFPGAKFRSHLMRRFDQFRKGGAIARLYITVRNADADLILISGDNLVSASTQKWQTPTDLAYRLFNLLDVYSMSGPEVEIHINGKHPDAIGNLAEFARQYFHTVTIHSEK